MAAQLDQKRHVIVESRQFPGEGSTRRCYGKPSQQGALPPAGLAADEHETVVAQGALHTHSATVAALRRTQVADTNRFRTTRGPFVLCRDVQADVGDT